jgi:hypothetical protein
MKLKLRPHQLDGFNRLENEQFGIMNCPTGSGKSCLINALCAQDLETQPQRKVIIAVPQKSIAKGFKKEMLIDVGSHFVKWQAPMNLCVDSRTNKEGQTTEKVRRLLDFVTNEGEDNGACLVTHHALALAAIELEKLSSANITLVIDEAHHIQSNDQTANLVGHLVRSWLQQAEPTAKFLFSTAYFFRGDKLSIIPDKFYEQFVRYHLPFDEYWNQLKYLKTYNYDFVCYQDTVWTPVENLLSKSSEPTIIYCPYEGHRLLLGETKTAFVSKLLKLACRHFNCREWEPDQQGKCIINLVPLHDRDKKVAFVEEHGDQVAAIITVDMFKEGSDWLQAQRIIDLLPSDSDQDRLQRFGRLIRDYSGKSHVNYYSFFPYAPLDDEERRRSSLSKLYAHFHASMILQQAIGPYRVPRRNCSTSETAHQESDNPFGDLPQATQQQVLAQSSKELAIAADDCRAHGKTLGDSDVCQIISKVLKSNGVEKHTEACAKQIIAIMRRKSHLRIYSSDLVEAGFDKVNKTDVLGNLLAYSGGVGGPETIAEIRAVVDTVFHSRWTEHYEKCRLLQSAPKECHPIYAWCVHNKVLHNARKLDSVKVQLLEQIPWWKWTRSMEDRWQHFFQFCSKLPQCPKSGTDEYSWVRQQKRLFFGNGKGHLSQDKICLLETIPWWTWSNQDVLWHNEYERIMQLPDPPAYGSADGEWVRYQKKRRRSGKLDSSRIKLLESIPWWKW